MVQLSVVPLILVSPVFVIAKLLGLDLEVLDPINCEVSGSSTSDLKELIFSRRLSKDVIGKWRWSKNEWFLIEFLNFTGILGGFLGKSCDINSIYNSQILNWLKGIIWIIPKSWRNNQHTETLGTIVGLRLDVKMLFIIAGRVLCFNAWLLAMEKSKMDGENLPDYIKIFLKYSIYLIYITYIYSRSSTFQKYHVSGSLRLFVLESPAGQLMWLHRFRDRGKHSYSKATGLQPHYTCTPVKTEELTWKGKEKPPSKPPVDVTIRTLLTTLACSWILGSATYLKAYLDFNDHQDNHWDRLNFPVDIEII